MTPQKYKPKMRFAPETMGVRKGTKHTLYESSGTMPMTLDGASVALSTSDKPHLYSTPMEEGAENRRIRRYSLLLSRYGLVDKYKFSKQRDLPMDIVTCAERLVALGAHKEIYGSDATVGTVHLAPLVSMLNAPDPSPSTIAHALSYAGTSAFRELLHMVNADVSRDLERAADDMSWTLEYYGRSIRRRINERGSGATRSTNKSYHEICNVLMRCVDSVEARGKEREEREARAREEQQRQLRGSDRYKRNLTSTLEGQRKKGKTAFLREIVPTMAGWEIALLEKMPLTLPHTGRKGRKLIPMPYGKSIRFIAREDTDPEQRVFSRKTRATGGVVVVDCSGSMNFGSDDLDRIMAATAGATVLCYSSGNASDEANIWLVAQNGRRTSILPEFPGNNGVDGPALEYGVALRRHNEPVVWISDTRVTGNNDVASSVLRDWCLNFCHRHNVYITPNSYEAASLLARIQQGKKPRLKGLHRNEVSEWQNYV